jgi:hypothetical protein
VNDETFWMLAVRRYGLEFCQEWEATFGLEGLIALYADEEYERKPTKLDT